MREKNQTKMRQKQANSKSAITFSDGHVTMLKVLKRILATVTKRLLVERHRSASLGKIFPLQVLAAVLYPPLKVKVLKVDITITKGPFRVTLFQASQRTVFLAVDCLQKALFMVIYQIRHFLTKKTPLDADFQRQINICLWNHNFLWCIWITYC